LCDVLRVDTLRKCYSDAPQPDTEGHAMTVKRPATRNAVLLLALGSLGWFVWPGMDALSREWKPTPTVQARDYTIISDTRKPGDIRMIFWLAPPLLPNNKIEQLLASYVIIGVVRARTLPGGTFSFDAIDSLQVKDRDAKPLRLLAGDDIPPVVNGTVTTLEGVFGQSFGAFGKGFHWFVFAAGSVDACKDGGLAIPLVDEVYTYETPIPGCTSYKHPDGTTSPAPSHAQLAEPPTAG
jgi:hypothetical protein